MKSDEVRIVEALYGCSFVPGTLPKRFVRNIYDRDRKKPLTDNQRFYLWAVAWSWRRQLPKDLIAMARIYSGGIGIRGPKAEAMERAK